LKVTKETALFPKMSQLKLQSFENKVKYEQQYLVFSKHGAEKAQKMAALAKRQGTPYIT
jgi:hypothetical protein